jgi:CDP-diacylglycerol---glycerol-3-phosphate 3-phosphatidyltransferase
VTATGTIGAVCDRVILWIVHGLALTRINPNVLTFLGLVINMGASALLWVGQFRWAGVVIIGAGLFDMVDGRVARETNRVTRFGGFFDSVLDRYSDLALLTGLLVWYGSINRHFYVLLTALAMTGSVMVSYTRSRAENTIPSCKVGFMERPERVVLVIIGALFDRMAAVLWVIAVLSNLTVVHRMIFTWREAKHLEEAQGGGRSVGAGGGGRGPGGGGGRERGDAAAATFRAAGETVKH